MATGVFCALTRRAYGGIESHNHNMITHLIELGERITVVAPHFEGDSEFDRECGYPIVRVDTDVGRGQGWRYIPDRIRMLKPTYQTIYREKADYVLCGSSDVQSFLLSAYLASRLSGKPMYAFSHDGPGDIVPVIKPFWSRMRNSVTFFCVSEHTRSRILTGGVNPQLAVTVPNGVCLSEVGRYKRSLSEFQSPRVNQAFGEGHPTILFVSRLVPRKRADILIDIMPRVVKSIPNARLVIVGDGSERHRLAKMASASSVRDSICILGRVSESEKWLCYDRCDLYVLPSVGEGFGIGYLEANALGKPVIGSRDSGTVDAVLHGETGILVDPESSKELAEAIIQILTNPTLAHELGENGRRRVEKEMNWATIATRVRSIVHSNPRVNPTLHRIDA